MKPTPSLRKLAAWIAVNGGVGALMWLSAISTVAVAMQPAAVAAVVINEAALLVIYDGGDKAQRHHQSDEGSSEEG